MGKDACDGYQKLSVYKLRKFGYFSSSGTNAVYWGAGEGRSSITLSTYLDAPIPRMHLSYTYTNRYTGTKVLVEEGVLLSKDNCHFGGVRWWMRCPRTRNGLPCGRRCAIFFLVGGHFGCKDCHDLTYESQQVRPSLRPYLSLLTPMTLDQKYARSRYWKGQKTKRTRRIDAKWDAWEEPAGLMNF